MYALVKMTYCTLQGMRTEENFCLVYLYQRVELFQQQVGVEEPSLPRKRSCPQRYETGNAEPHYSDLITTEKIYFEVTNLVVNSIYSCFKQPGYTKYAWLESLLLKTTSKTDFSGEIEVTSVYDSDINAAQVSMQLLWGHGSVAHM